MFEWKPEYSMGLHTLDREHQTIFRMASQLHEAMRAGKAAAVTGPLLEALLRYTVVHFGHEERLMRDAGYPDYASHKAAHDGLTREVVKFAEECAGGNSVLTVRLFHFLKDWLVNHIQGTDRKYVPHLKSRAA